MEKNQLEKSEETNRQISSNTCNNKQIVEKANERPEWLPDGWNVDFRTRKSGANMGYGYKCYIDPLNGYKFYSKPEVLRYLETIKANSCTFKEEERCNTTHSQSNVIFEKSNVEDLPPGWVKEVKTRKSGNGIKKDPFYTDPVSGYVFRSKKDVQRYLESGDISTCVFKPNKRQIQDEDKFTPSSAGKRHKLKLSATKRRLFVGKETSDESSLALPDANSSKKGQDVKLSSGMMAASVPTSESVANMHSLDNVGADPPERKKTSDPDYLQEKNCIVHVIENANEKDHSNPRVYKNKEEFSVAPRFSQRLAGIEPDQLTNNVTNEQTVQGPKRNLRISRTTIDVDMANKSSQQLNGVPEIEHSRKMQGEVLNKNKVSKDQRVFREQPHWLETENIEDNKPEQNQYSLFRDSSLTSHKVAMKTIVRGELPSPDTPHNGHGLASESLVSKEKKLLANEIGKSGLQEIQNNSNKSRDKKESHIPCRASKRLAGLEPELGSNSISYEKAPEYKSKRSKGEVNEELHQSEGGPVMKLTDHASINGESSDKSIKPPEIPTITNNQPEKLEDDEMNDEKSEPQLSFAFHYSWSDPSLDSAIKTLTGALPVEDSAGNGPTRIPENDMFYENKLFENVRGSSSDKKPQVNSKKSKNKKELTMPRRLSKRLAGCEPDVLPAEKAPEYATRKSCKDKPTANTSVISTNGAAGHLDVGGENKLILHASNSLETGVRGESSSESEKPYDAQTVHKEQLQKLEAGNIGERSEPQLPLPFGDSWSDPCLEFAIKTLTGALPVDSAADILPVMTTDVDDSPNKEFLKGVVQKSISEEAHDNSNQPQNKELNMVCQPSQQLLGQPELRTCSTPCENDPNFAKREYCSNDGSVKGNSDGGESINIEAATQPAHHFRNINTQVLESESVPAEQPQHETETINHGNSESQFGASFMDSWSDPCLEFAFKTLTGAIPVEENIAIQGCFQEPAYRNDQKDGSSKLPDFGSSSFSQSDISFHNDIGEKAMPGQQSSTSPSFLTSDQSSLHGCTGVGPQKHYSQCNNNFRGR